LFAPRGLATTFPVFFNPPKISLEWAVEEASFIARGTVRPGMCRKISGSVPQQFEVTLDVTEILKGGHYEQVTFTAPAIAGLDADGKTWADVLVFLVKTPGEAKANASSQEIGGWAVYRGWAFVLGERTPTVLLMNQETVSDGDSLLRATAEAAKYGKKRLEPCEATAVGTTIVPRDGRLEALGRQWIMSADHSRRMEGVAVIGSFDSQENALLVRKLLAGDAAYHMDAAEEWSPALEERYWKEYPVREQALNVLVKWKKTRGVDAEIRAPSMRYAAVTWWPVLTAFGLVLLIGLLAWRRAGFAAFAMVVLIGLALLFAFAWGRSLRIGETYSVAGSLGDLEIVCGDGKVALLRVQDDAPAHGWFVRKYEANEPPGSLWFAQYLKPREDLGKGSFRWAEGMTAGNGYSFSLLELPFWVVVAVLLALPLARGAAKLGRTVRRRRRTRENRCVACGYDLRGSSGRCPECGASRAKSSTLLMVTMLLLAGLPARICAANPSSISSIEAQVAKADLIVRGKMIWGTGAYAGKVEVNEILKGNTAVQR
jgi:hypothetical protein